MWTKLDDGFYDHPKVIRCSLEAIGLHAIALSYCGRYLTGGEIPAEASFLRGRTRLIKELLRAGLWESVKTRLRIHDWADHNPTAEEARQYRERMRAVRSEGGKARAATASRIAGRFAPADTSNAAGDLHQPRPVPVPRPSLGKRTSTSAADAPDRAPAAVAIWDSSGFVIPPSLLSRWEQAYPAVDVKQEVCMAHAWAEANPRNRKSNWTRFLVGWLRRAQDRAPARGSGTVARSSPNGSAPSQVPGVEATDRLLARVRNP